MLFIFNKHAMKYHNVVKSGRGEYSLLIYIGIYC